MIWLVISAGAVVAWVVLLVIATGRRGVESRNAWDELADVLLLAWLLDILDCNDD